MRFVLGAVVLFCTTWIASGGSYAEDFTTLPSRSEAAEVCEFVAKLQRVDDFTLRFGVFDVNNDGRPEVVRSSKSIGTMGGDFFEFETADKSLLEMQPIGFEWKDYGALGGFWLPYRGRMYYLATTEESGRYLLYLAYTLSTNQQHIVCEFANETTEQILATSQQADFEICRAVTDKAVTYVADEAETAETPADLKRAETFLRAKATVDFANDGQDEVLAGLQYASGAGRGCDLQYYDLLGFGTGDLALRSRRQMLLDAQRISSDERHPGRCGTRAHLFQFKGSTYLEISGLDLREISLTHGAATRQVCRGYYSTKHSVKSYYPTRPAPQR